VDGPADRNLLTELVIAPQPSGSGTGQDTASSGAVLAGAGIEEPCRKKCLSRAGSVGAAQAALGRCAWRAPGRHAGSARTLPDVPATAARAQRIRSAAVSGYSP